MPDTSITGSQRVGVPRFRSNRFVGTSMIYLTNRFPNNPRSITSLRTETESQHQPQEEVISLHHFSVPTHDPLWNGNPPNATYSTHESQYNTNCSKTHILPQTMSHNANEPQSLVIFRPEPTTQNESKHPNHPKTIHRATAFRRIFDAAVPTETPCEATFPVSVCACKKEGLGRSPGNVAGQQASRWSGVGECAIFVFTTSRQIHWTLVIRLNSPRLCSFFEIFLVIVTEAYTTLNYGTYPAMLSFLMSYRVIC